MKVVCAVLFIAFTFCYLYFYQADILAVAQHVLSGGRTHYNRLIGAVLITLALFLLQLGVYSLTRLERRSHALTYFPSLLILTVITDISPNIDRHFTFGAWLWVVPLLLILYSLWARMSRNFQPFEPDTNSSGLFSRMMWINVLTLGVMFFLVGVFSNHNDVFHYRMKAESCLVHNDCRAAGEVGRKALATDSSLTMIRVYALGRQGRLGSDLFTYPLVGGSESLLPNGSSVRLMLYSEKDFYRHLGKVVVPKMPPRKYLEYIVRHRVGKPMAVDYLLTAYLLDCDLDAFAGAITGFYDITKPLPTHYKEALVLYNHLRSVPKIEYHDSVLDADYDDFTKLYRSQKDPVVRKATVRTTYGNTYWFYYMLHN